MSTTPEHAHGFTCGYQPGHGLHYIQLNQNGDGAIAATVEEVRGDGTIVLRTADGTVTRWHHDPRFVRAALAEFHGTGDAMADDAVIALRHPEVGPTHDAAILERSVLWVGGHYISVAEEPSPCSDFILADTETRDGVLFAAGAISTRSARNTSKPNHRRRTRRSKR